MLASLALLYQGRLAIGEAGAVRELSGLLVDSGETGVREACSSALLAMSEVCGRARTAPRPSLCALACPPHARRSRTTEPRRVHNARGAREDRGDSRECAGRRPPGGEAVQLAHAGQPLAARPRHQRGAGRWHHDAPRSRPRPRSGAPRRGGLGPRVQRAADAVEHGEHARWQGRRPRRLPPPLPRAPLLRLQPAGAAAQRGGHHGNHHQ